MHELYPLTIIGLLLISFSCSEDTSISVDPGDLLGAWELKEFLLEGDIGIPIPARVSLTLEQGSKDLKFDGESTCNEYLGEMSLQSEQTMKVLAFGSTERGCTSQELNTFESIYFEALPLMENYKLRGDRLILSYENTFLAYQLVPE